MAEYKTKVLIIGSGPAGYTAGIYAARAGMRPVLVSGLQKGGQLTITTDVENFPGFPEPINGGELMQRMHDQAVNVGVEIVDDQISEVDFSARPFVLISEGANSYRAESVIIATGASARWLGLENEEKFRGFGVSGCATCDGFFYRNQDVIVVGGGDSACEEATYLASICNKVYMVVRKDHLRASKAMQRRVMETPNIEIKFGYNTVQVLGDQNGVTGALVRHSGGEELVIDATGFFLAIGHTPNTAVFKGALELDAEGYIRTEPGTSRTSVPGVFAAGDVQDPHYRQAGRVVWPRSTASTICWGCNRGSCDRSASSFSHRRRLRVRTCGARRVPFSGRALRTVPGVSPADRDSSRAGRDDA